MIEAMSLATGTVEIIYHCKLETTRRQVCHPPRPPHPSHPRNIAHQNPPPHEPTLHIVAKNHTLWQRGTTGHIQCRVRVPDLLLRLVECLS
jgi:hypothetical protein